MRAVTKPVRVPAGLSPNNLAAVINTANPLHKKSIQSTTYRHISVLNKLSSLYFNKCAYCESFDPEFEVEHYRPKNSVQEDPAHPGYYWLCYEWTNLMPACHDCNKGRSKHTHFPINGVRVAVPTLVGGIVNRPDCLLESATLYANEIPLLLNPEITGFDPNHYFRMTPTGRFKPRPAVGTLDYERADKTITTMRLNRSKLYVIERKIVIVTYIERVSMHFLQLLSGEIQPAAFDNILLAILKEINENSKVKNTSQYSFFWKSFLNNFKDMIQFHATQASRIYLKARYDALIGSI